MNPHVLVRTREFKSLASTNSAIPARHGMVIHSLEDDKVKVHDAHNTCRPRMWTLERSSAVERQDTAEDALSLRTPRLSSSCQRQATVRARRLTQLFAYSRRVLSPTEHLKHGE